MVGKRIVVLWLTTALMLTLAACAGDNPGDKPGDTATSAVTAGTTVPSGSVPETPTTEASATKEQGELPAADPSEWNNVSGTAGGETKPAGSAASQPATSASVSAETTRSETTAAQPTPSATETHQHVSVVDPAVGSTCQRTGLTEGSHCSVCGQVLVPQQEVPMAEHLYLDGHCIWCGAEGENSGGIELPPDPLFGQ